MKIQKLHFKMILAGLVSTLVTTQAMGMAYKCRFLKAGSRYF